jgi:hypothetical protein
MKRSILLVLASVLLAASPGHATNSVGLVWEYAGPNPMTIFGSNGTTPLAGNAAVNGGTGFVLQLGYYTNATVSNPFAGTWVPVFGPGNADSNSLFSTAGMGEGPGVSTTGTDDSFIFNGTVIDSTPSTENGIPAAGTIMSIRYYNATSVAAATYFGAISDVDTAASAAWLWISPSNPAPFQGMSFNFSNTGVEYEAPGGTVSGVVTMPETNIPVSVPEPAAFWSVAGALAIGATVRRRRKVDPV